MSPTALEALLGDLKNFRLPRPCSTQNILTCSAATSTPCEHACSHQSQCSALSMIMAMPLHARSKILCIGSSAVCRHNLVTPSQRRPRGADKTVARQLPHKLCAALRQLPARCDHVQHDHVQLEPATRRWYALEGFTRPMSSPSNSASLGVRSLIGV